MKIEKSVRRRFFWLLLFLSLVLLPHLILSAVQTFWDKDYRTSSECTILGWVDCNPFAEGSSVEPYCLLSAADGSPEVCALPTSLVVYAPEGEYPMPKHPLLVWRKALLWLDFLLLGVVVGLLVALLYQILRGLRSEELIFTRCSVRLMRWLALPLFLYVLIRDNLVGCFESGAFAQLYEATSPLALFGTFTLQGWALIIPLFLLIFAELMAIANRLNEEESATL